MKKLTYVLQVFAVAFMTFAALLVAFSVSVGRYEFAAINGVFFVVNAGLFLMQRWIRRELVE